MRLVGLPDMCLEPGMCLETVQGRSALGVLLLRISRDVLLGPGHEVVEGISSVSRWLYRPPVPALRTNDEGEEV